MQTVNIRGAIAQDVPEITHLLWDDPQGGQRESKTAEQATTYLSAFERIEKDPNSQVFVAIRDETVIGCLQLTIIPGLSYRGALRALIEDVRVARAFRNHRIGARLLAHAETRASEQGCNLIELFVHGERADAHRFYERAQYSGDHKGYRKTLPSL